MSFPTDGYSVTGAQANIHVVNNTTLDEAVLNISFNNLGGTSQEYAAIQAAISAAEASLLSDVPGGISNGSIRYTSQIMG